MANKRVSIPSDAKKEVEKTVYYCPACGKQEVYAELVPVDGRHAGYYGCASCKETWSMDPWAEAERADGLDMHRIARLSAECTDLTH